MKKYLFLPVLVMLFIIEQTHAISSRVTSYEDKGENNTLLSFVFDILLFLVFIGIIAYIIFILYRIYKRDLKMGEVIAQVQSLFGTNTKQTIRKALKYIFLINKYKEYPIFQIIYGLIVIVCIGITGFYLYDTGHIFRGIKGCIISIVAGRVIVEIIVYLSHGFVYGGTSIQETKKNDGIISTPRKNTDGILLLFALIGIIVSLFLPFIQVDSYTSYSLSSISTELDTFLTKSISETVSTFMWQSVLAGISIVVAYRMRGTIISLVGLFGMYFYGQLIMGNSAISTLFKLLKKTGVGGDSLASGFYLYGLSSLFLIIGCFGIIVGYLELIGKKK